MTIAERVPASFKIQARTKKRLDLLATALGVEKSEIIDEAVALYNERRKNEVTNYIQEAGDDFSALSSEERLIGRPRERRPERARQAAAS